MWIFFLCEAMVLLLSAAEIFQAQNLYGPIKWASDPCPIHFYAFFQNFDGPLENYLFALGKNRWAQESLMPMLELNNHQIWIPYDSGPAKTKIQIHSLCKR